MEEDYRVKFSSILLFVAALGILFALPWFNAQGFSMWITAKILFFLGVILMIFRK